MNIPAAFRDLLRPTAPPVRPRPRKGPRPGLLLPYGLTSDLEPGRELWEALATCGPSRPKVYGIVMPWGALHEDVLNRHPAFLASSVGISDREARLHGSARLRAWIDTFGGQHSGLVTVVAGPLVPVWNRAIVGSPYASRVKLVSLPKRSRAEPWGYARRQVAAHLSRMQR